MAKTDNMTAEKVDLDKVLAKARQGFGKNEKALAQQMKKGSQILRPTKESDFVKSPENHWESLCGIMGIPFGRIVQIAGRPDSGKSSHAMMFMKAAQDQGVIVILWDSENKFSKGRFDRHFRGCSDDLLLIESRVILEGGDMALNLIESCMELYPNKKILFVWDSVGGTISGGASEKNLRDKNQMAMEAKDNGKVCRALVQIMEQYKNRETGEEKIGVLLVNQVYANIGSPGQKESGGQKVEFHSSLILQLTRKADLFQTRGSKKYKIGITTRARVKKNHLFDGEDSIAEMILKITAGGISIFEDKKSKKDKKDGDPDEDLEEGPDDAHSEEDGDEEGEE